MNKDIFRYTKTLKIYHPQILSGKKKEYISDRRKWIQEDKVVYKKLQWEKKIVKYIVNSKWEAIKQKCL